MPAECMNRSIPLSGSRRYRNAPSAPSSRAASSAAPWRSAATSPPNGTRVERRDVGCRGFGCGRRGGRSCLGAGASGGHDAVESGIGRGSRPDAGQAALPRSGRTSSVAARVAVVGRSTHRAIVVDDGRHGGWRRSWTAIGDPRPGRRPGRRPYGASIAGDTPPVGHQQSVARHPRHIPEVSREPVVRQGPHRRRRRAPLRHRRPRPGHRLHPQHPRRAAVHAQRRRLRRLRDRDDRADLARRPFRWLVRLGSSATR